VGLLVMQMGAYLVPAVGTRDALIAIVLGSLLGAALLGWTAKLGCDRGLTSAGLMHAAFGSWFARLPVLLNIVQLIGWTTFELVIMRDGTSSILRSAWGWTAAGHWATVLTTLFWGAILTLLLAGSMLQVVRRFVSRMGLPLVVASLLWLSWQFGSQLYDQGWAAFWQRPGDGSRGWLSAMDLVIAMPISWLPLVADYARHGRSGRSALAGVGLGYVLANIWCYTLGVMVVSVVQPGVDLVAALLLAQGGLLALSLILIDELDNAYGDVYSSAVNAHSLLPRWSIRQWGMVLALFCTGLALVLPIHNLEPFMLLLSSVFVPLYGVILGRSFLRTSPQSPLRNINRSAAVLWLLGVALYHALAQWAPGWGATLPTLLVTLLLARLTHPPAA
jgi:putative hydroxymethylpyrimidine transporter CytX